MTLEPPPWLWGVLAFGALCVGAMPATVGDALAAVIASTALIVAVRSVRTLGDLSWRFLTVGGVLVGLAPVITEIHRSVLGDHVVTLGDLVAYAGFISFIAGLRRLVLIRTVAPQPQVVVASALACSWLTLAIAVGAGRAVNDALEGLEQLIAVSYLPFVIVPIYYMFRLLLGSRERSTSFRLLLLGTALTALSEIVFLQVAAGVDGLRSVGVVLATLSLVLLGAAISDPSAKNLESPAEPRASRLTLPRAAFLVASFVAVVCVAVTIDLGAVEALLVLAIAILTALRTVLLVAERDNWVQLESSFRELASDLVEGESVSDLRDIGCSSAERVLSAKEFSFVDFRLGDEVDEALGLSDPSGSGFNEVDGDVQLALSSGETQKSEWAQSHGRSRYSSRLVVPVDGGAAGYGVLLVEAAPVLTPAEIGHLELLGASLGLAMSTSTERAAAQKRRADQKFRALVQDSNDIVLLVSPEERVVTLASPTIERLAGYPNHEMLGKSPFVHLHPDHLDRAERLLGGRRETTEPLDVRVMHADGQLRWFALTIRDMTHDEELGGFVVSFGDVHARKMAEVQVSTSENRFRSLIEHSEDVFALVTDDLRFTFISPNIERMLGYSAADLVGTHVTGLVAPESMEELSTFIDRPRKDLDGRSTEVKLKTRHGETRWINVTLTKDAINDDDVIVVAARDITERRELEESMRDAALHDPLTGLYNRASLQHEIHRCLQRMSANEHTGALLVDVRDFRLVNESLGFEVGDGLLIEIAGRLRSGLRADDVLARLGADSFVVLTTSDSVSGLVDFANRLSGVFIEPFRVGDRRHQIGVAIGIASTNDRRDNATRLLEEAALAVRTAKVGATPVVAYEAWMREMATERFELEADLLPALAASQFSVAYQPLLTLVSHQVRGVEALMRWQHPQRGHVSPATFIPVAEKSGAITELGRWVLDAACRQLAEWHKELPDASALGMSVNVSGRQLEDGGEFDVLYDIIRSSGVDPRALTLELTETTMIDGIDSVRVQLERFRSLGISIAVDDFGTGTAGLNHMRDVPFDVLKVDKSYVDPLGRTDEAYSLLSGVVDLAHAMGAIVVAEGIETPAQANELRRMSCDVGQGFYLGRPMDRARIEDWFARGRQGSVASQIQQVRA